MNAEDKAAEGFGQDKKGKSVDRHTELEVDQAEQQAENPEQKEVAHKIKDELEPVAHHKDEDEEAERQQ
ncbi:MAG: hypothetical protein C4331_02025 [Meiothermus sp.]